MVITDVPLVEGEAPTGERLVTRILVSGVHRPSLGIFRGSESAPADSEPARQEWARLGSNQGPTDYESAALTS